MIKLHPYVSLSCIYNQISIASYERYIIASIARINEKLTPSSFPQWRARFEALQLKHHRVRQDKLILSAILASTSPTITSLIATAKTSYDAWKKLSTMYASKSSTRAMQLKEELTLIQCGNRPILKYLHVVKGLADEIALIDHPISDDDITLYVLNGLGPEFREIAAPIRAREKSLAFEELHDLVIGHENYLRRMEATTQQLVAATNFTSRRSSFSTSQQQKASHKGNGSPRSQGQHRFSNSNGPSRDPRRSNNQGRFNSNQRRYQPKCQYCDQMGHTAKACPQLNSSKMTVNCAGTSDGTIHGGDTTKSPFLSKPSTGQKPTYFLSPHLFLCLISSPSSFHSCASILTVLSIAIMNGWPLKQMDVNNAFLHGNLKLYMVQPPGFKDLSRHDYVCGSESNLCNDKKFVAHVVTKLGDQFSLKDMGSLHYFLGVEVIPTTAGVFLSQHKYVRDILENTHMAGAKDVSTPLSTTQSLHLVDGTNAVNSIEYRRVIGSLQYLSLTRPDISFAIGLETLMIEHPHQLTLHFWAAIPSHGVQKNNELLLVPPQKQNIECWPMLPPSLLCDNLGATHLSFNPVQHSRMKHIQIDLHFVRDQVQKGALKVSYVHTQDQLVDLLTKPLSRERTECLRAKIGLADGSSILRGRIKESDTR
ncbi:hypothetical protein AAG906_018644 [Vitis piasezkii]